VPNLEQIAALQPDLVFGWAELVDALAGIAPVYVVVDGQDSYQESHEEIRMFARLLGREDIAEANIQSALDRLAAYQALAPRDVSVMYGFFSDSAFSYRDGQSGTCNLLNRVARCDWADPEGSASWSVQINDEALLTLNPDVLLISGYGFEGQPAEEVIAVLAARPLWAELAAVQTGQVHVITTSPTNMDGMGTVGMVQMLDVLMPLIYPDVFPDALTDEQVEEILAGESANSSGYPVIVTDMTGQELTLDAPPQRVICLLNRCAQELAFIGVVPIAVGAPYTFNVARDPLNFGEQAESFAQIPQGGDLDWELIASFEPDLIIGEVEMRAAAEGIAPVYAYSWDASVWQSIDNFTTDVRNFGHIFGLESEVEAKIQSVLNRVAAYATLSPNNRSHLVFFFSDDTGSSLWIPGDCGLFLSQLSPCGNPNGGDWIEGTIETLLSFDPDVLIVEQYSVDNEAAMLENLNATNPLWNELTAVQSGDVHLVPVSQARTNTIQSVRGAVDALMPLIYPNVFPAPLTDEQVQEILAGAS
jgi:iron complex transport system substrate-binding protein